MNLKELSLRELLDRKESLKVLNERYSFILSNEENLDEKMITLKKKKLIISKLDDIFSELENRLLS